jgi:L-ascorbate metabolism protein UlaG (beta-lactamase superfamily)
VGEIDILMVTVDDSCHLLTYPEIDQLIDMVQPRVVIPMHYQIPGLMSEQSTLQTIEAWLLTRSRVRHWGGPVISLSPRDLPDTPETWVFEPDPASFETERVEP